MRKPNEPEITKASNTVQGWVSCDCGRKLFWVNRFTTGEIWIRCGSCSKDVRIILGISVLTNDTE